jgi:uncharacterized protein (TIGR01777 family)
MPGVKVVVAGGTGFVGRALSASLARGGHDVVVLTRDAHVRSQQRVVTWDARDPTAPWVNEVRGAATVVNLAGASIGGARWTAARKRTLIDSRVRSTEALVRAMAQVPERERPQVFVVASGIDYYGDHPGDEALDESAPAGSSFLARLCADWEDAAQRAEPLGVRVVRMRTALCIGRGAPALRMLALPFRLFAGGPLGNGRQWFTWIHLEDLVNLYVLAIERSELAGPINAVAPQVPREYEVAQAIAHVLHRPSWAPAPSFALRAALGAMADVVLHGRRAVPSKALAQGYEFRYTEIEPALGQALTGA